MSLIGRGACPGAGVHRGCTPTRRLLIGDAGPGIGGHRRYLFVILVQEVCRFGVVVGTVSGRCPGWTVARARSTGT